MRSMPRASSAAAAKSRRRLFDFRFEEIEACIMRFECFQPLLDLPGFITPKAGEVDDLIGRLVDHRAKERACTARPEAHAAGRHLRRARYAARLRRWPLQHMQRAGAGLRRCRVMLIERNLKAEDDLRPARWQQRLEAVRGRIIYAPEPVDDEFRRFLLRLA
ncbi:hypothetical protein HK436_11870 [Mesorhizobium sediminum]|nr:hypothetical protein [Mesorhizobium sediminum]NRC54348.1 hypothetical protein [Mesorhizobium sediminum]